MPDGHQTFPGKVFAYLLPKSRPAGWPTRDYMNTCEAGYRHFGFDTHALWEAFETSHEESGGAE